MDRRVVVTGIGLISPVGNTREACWDALLAGQGGIGPITHFDAADFAVKIAGEVKDFDPGAVLDRKEQRRTDRFAQFALVASEEAMADAGLLADRPDGDRTGVIIGSGIGGMGTFEANHSALVERGPARVSPYFVPMMIGDIAAGLVSIRHGLRGPNYGVVSACATGAHAIIDAALQIKAGRADIMLCGGAEATVCPMAIAGFGNMKALSTRNDDPARASRPFDRERDGFVVAEGAGILVVEEWEHARARGARAYAELLGAGLTGDAHHITAPDPDGRGASAAMAMALREGGVAPEQVDYVNAHGTSTPFNDRVETAAMRRFFGGHAEALKISSTKSMTGHLLGAAGGFEAGISALVVDRERIPPTINLEHPDPECDLDYVPNASITHPVGIAISTSLGFGGHNTVLLLAKAPDRR
ncbi:MAG: beta-ketoacyl-ACP synthase II [Candidatus Krumholzibacteriota bacterium]|nr:beta-ketoacyl-ACP synthase II [Candidatus Krumholzibacteriota bacterium]